MIIPAKKAKKDKLILENIVLKYNNNSIQFVNEARLLGVIIDNKLDFNTHIKTITYKVKAKWQLLRKSLHLFPKSFKVTLFKLFILPNFYYCSSLLLHTKNKYRERLQKYYAKSIFFILKTKTAKLTDEDQYAKFKKLELNILPYNYRMFQHFASFLYSVAHNIKLNLALGS